MKRSINFKYLNDTLIKSNTRTVLNCLKIRRRLTLMTWKLIIFKCLQTKVYFTVGDFRNAPVSKTPIASFRHNTSIDSSISLLTLFRKNSVNCLLVDWKMRCFTRIVSIWLFFWWVLEKEGISCEGENGGGNVSEVFFYILGALGGLWRQGRYDLPKFVYLNG